MPANPNGPRLRGVRNIVSLHLAARARRFLQRRRAAFINFPVNLNKTGEQKGMTTQDLQSLKAELHDLEGELHGIAVKIERIEQERAAGQTEAAHSDSELSTAREQLLTFESRRTELQRQIAELENTLEDY
jgi:chromosome segregation ATPase